MEGRPLRRGDGEYRDRRGNSGVDDFCRRSWEDNEPSFYPEREKEKQKGGKRFPRIEGGGSVEPPSLRKKESRSTKVRSLKQGEGNKRGDRPAKRATNGRTRARAKKDSLIAALEISTARREGGVVCKSRIFIRKDKKGMRPTPDTLGKKHTIETDMSAGVLKVDEQSAV